MYGTGDSFNNALVGFIFRVAAIEEFDDWEDEGPAAGEGDKRYWRSKSTGEVRIQIERPGTPSTKESVKAPTRPQDEANGRRPLVTPEEDEAYLKAVESGSMERAKKMVGDAAAKAGYNIFVYHGTNEEFDEFGKQRTARGYYFTTEPETADIYGKPLEFFLKSDKSIDLDDEFDAVAKEAIYGEDMYRDENGLKELANEICGEFDKYYNENTENGQNAIKKVANNLSEANWRTISGDELVNEFKDVPENKRWAEIKKYVLDELRETVGSEKYSEDFIEKYDKIKKRADELAPQKNRNIEFARDAYGGQEFYLNYQDDFITTAHGMGNDLVIFTDNGAPSYVVFDPERIKSAEVTKDKDGNVIPLSKRFNPNTRDLRY